MRKNVGLLYSHLLLSIRPNQSTVKVTLSVCTHLWTYELLCRVGQTLGRRSLSSFDSMVTALCTPKKIL